MYNFDGFITIHLFDAILNWGRDQQQLIWIWSDKSL